MNFGTVLIGIALIIESPLYAQQTRDSTSADTLKTVTVSANRSLLEQKIDRQVFHAGSLISNAGANGLDVLNSAPGVRVEETGEVSLKGRAGALILIDDKPVFLSGTDLVNYLRSLPPGTIDQIELMSNPPARYKADGAAGIINIKTQNNKEAGWNGSAVASYSQGRYAKTNGSVNLFYRQNQTNWNAGIGHSLANNFFQTDRQRNYQLTQLLLGQSNYEISSRSSLNYRLGCDTRLSPRIQMGINLNGSTSHYHEDSQYETSFSKPAEAADSFMSVHSIQNTQAYINMGDANLNYSLKQGSQLSMDISYLSYRYTQKQNSTGRTALPDGSVSSRYDLLSANPFTAHILSGRLDYEDQLNKNAKLETGVQASYSQRRSEGVYFNMANGQVIPNNTFSNSYHYQEQITAAYTDFSSAFRQWSFKAGLRMEHTDASGHLFAAASNKDSLIHQSYLNLFPTLFLSYRLDSSGKNLLIFSTGRRILRPAYQDLNPSIFLFDKYTLLTGNPLLKPEYANNFELSLSHQNKWTIALVYSRSKDAILQVFRQTDSVFTMLNVNLSAFSRIGLNSTHSIRIAKWWEINNYVEVNRVHYKGNLFNEQVLDAARTTVRITSTHRFSLSTNWSAELGGFYKNSVLLGQATLAPGWQMYASVQRKLFQTKANLTLTVRDLARSWVVRRSIELNGLMASNTNRLDTRLINLTFTYKLGKTVSTRTHRSAMDAEQSRL